MRLLLLLLSLAVYALAQTNDKEAAPTGSASGLSAMINHLESSKNCSKNLHTCHIMNAGLGIFAVVMLLLNVGQMVWFNRVGIRDGVGNIAARLSRNRAQHPHDQLVNEDDDLDFSRPTAPQF